MKITGEEVEHTEEDDEALVKRVTEVASQAVKEDGLICIWFMVMREGGEKEYDVHTVGVLRKPKLTQEVFRVAQLAMLRDFGQPELADLLEAAQLARTQNAPTTDTPQ